MKKLTYQNKGNVVEATGFVSWGGTSGSREKRFAAGPVRLTDTPVDHFLAAIHKRSGGSNT